MSKIYRSLDAKPAVHPLDLRDSPMGPQRQRRPAGGFAGTASPEAFAGPPLSIIERREREAQQLLEDAQRRAEEIQRDAYHEGFAEGERAGQKLADQKIEPTLQSLQALIRAMETERASLIEQHEQELIKVAFAIATQVVKRAIELEPERLDDVINAALTKLSRAQTIKLVLSPIDAQLLEQQMSRGEGIDWPPEHLTIERDEAIGRGGCRIETDTGDIDATIETQLRVLKNTLWTE